MTKTRFTVSMSLDGFVAGADQSAEQPLGEGGEALHGWLTPLAAWRGSHGLEGGETDASARVVAELGSGFSAENLGDPAPRLEIVEAIDAPGVTHVRCRVVG